MSRFANPTKVERFYYPDCACPGKPHDRDWMAMRTELGAEDVAKLNAFGALGALGSPSALGLLIKEWNLQDDEGKDVPVTQEAVSLLWSDAAGNDALNEWIDEHVRLTSLPNGSGGRSPNGSSATASPTPDSPAAPSSTTSS